MSSAGYFINVHRRSEDVVVSSFGGSWKWWGLVRKSEWRGPVSVLSPTQILRACDFVGNFVRVRLC